jgi:FkbM family methyltransferase
MPDGAGALMEIEPANLGSFRSLTGADVRVKIVDIGANPLTDGAAPYERLLRAGDADVIGFEPNPDALAKLDQIKGPTETYLPYAIADGQRRTLNCQAPGMTSLLTPNRQVLELFHGFPEWGTVIGTEEVDTKRLDDIDETAGIDMVKIDIQGGELMALSHAEERLKTTLVIQTEVEFLPMYENQPLFSDVDLFLRKQGFMLHRFYPAVSRVMRPLLVENNIYAGLSQLFWADAIFIKDITRLDVLGDQQLLKMAAILHDCYGSIDVVLRLLAEHDTRTGSGYGGAYLAALQVALGR